MSCICLATSFAATGCGSAADPDYERFALVREGIPFFAEDTLAFDASSFQTFADDTCGLTDEQLGEAYDAESGDGTSIYMLLAFACGDEVADRALNASSEDIASRQTIRSQYRREFSTMEKARATVEEAKKAQAEMGDG